MSDNQSNHNTESTSNQTTHQSHGNNAAQQHEQKDNQHNGSSNSKSTDMVDYTAAKSAAMTLRAINHKLRQQIVALLDENKRMNVTDIYVKLRLEQSVASQHLAILRRADIVKTVREGKFIHYALNYDRISEVSKFIQQITAGEKAA